MRETENDPDERCGESNVASLLIELTIRLIVSGETRGYGGASVSA